MNYLLEQFLKYIKINTMSNEDSNTTPSTNYQFDLANEIKADLEKLGLKDIKLNEYAILTAKLESNCNSNLTIGFLAHLDTIPGFSGKNVSPQIINNYDGKDIDLGNIKIKVNEFTFLRKLKGHTIITTDGTTVLGADDKAGISEIMAMLHYFKNNPQIKHHNIYVAFTPDEEIGTGILKFNLDDFKCDYAYTVDGGMYNEISYNNFNASSCKVKIFGKDIHPGDAKGHMLNASLIAMEFQNLLPTFNNPMYTEGFEGFIHLCSINGDVSNCTLDYIIRDHNLKKLKKLEDMLTLAANFINKIYGNNTIIIDIKREYYNMYEYIKKDKRSINKAIKAIKDAGFIPISSPIRGGTDGAKLTEMGLNTPNLGTGGYNPHGPYELASLNEMENVVKILINIAKK